MKKILIAVIAMMLFSLDVQAAEQSWEFESSSISDKKKHIILDMDFCTDVDDACALRMAAQMDKRGEIVLEAVTLSTCDSMTGESLNIRAVDGMLDYVGIDVPIGKSSIYIPDESSYWEILASYSDGNMEVFDAVDLWKQKIDECKDRGIDLTIVTTGYLTNIKAFGDRYGTELLKNCTFFIVGGTNGVGTDNNFSYCEEARIASDFAAKNIVGDDNVFWITNDVGAPLLCGGSLMKNNPDDPVSKSLLAFQESLGIDATCGRAAWDPVGVYLAANYFIDDGLEGFDKERIHMDITNGTNTVSRAGELDSFRLFRNSDDYSWYNKILDSEMSD